MGAESVHSLLAGFLYSSGVGEIHLCVLVIHSVHLLLDFMV